MYQFENLKMKGKIFFMLPVAVFISVMIIFSMVSINAAINFMLQAAAFHGIFVASHSCTVNLFGTTLKLHHA
jgi:hypothetical protein